MCKILFCFLFSIFTLFNFVNCNDCDAKAIFTINQRNTQSAIWKNGTSLSSYGCDVKDYITVITHGWGGVGSFVPLLVQKYLQYRGGCVIYFNYSACVDMSNYVTSLGLWQSASAVLTEKLHEIETEGVLPANISMYGFSLGARVAIDAAINYGTQKVGSMYVCEPANDGFDYIYTKDPKTAAQDVQCMFTSSYFGSAIRNQCHQNWLMGYCGYWQAGANDYLPFTDAGSHGMCNAIYTSAFDNDFVANNVNNCMGVNPPSTIPAGFKMGYRENRTYVQGVFAAPTYVKYPYNA